MKKIKLKQDIINEYSSLKEIISFTFVGSFLDKENYSDIDIVIIVKNLNKELFNILKSKIKNLNLKKYNIKKNLIINLSFGPLKYDYKKNIVFHLMIYDLEDHIKHTLTSPFTCYDWQRYKASIGKNLSDLYPVYGISFDDFLMNDRGIKSYIKNLNNNQISFKDLKFSNKKPLLEKKNFNINNDIAMAEFSYHIIKYLISNLLKILNYKNKSFRSKKISLLIREIYKDSATDMKSILNFYKILDDFKINNNSKNLPTYNFTKDITLKFILKFKSYIKFLNNNLKKVIFMRHFKTSLSSNVFLGKKLNPPIKKKIKKSKEKYELVITSKLRRALQTGKIFGKELETNYLLNEIDYGSAEGMNIKELENSYPNILSKWKKGKDVRFPDGENHRQVMQRVSKFLKSLFIKNENKILIVSHNVFLRCLIAKYYKIKTENIYKIKINYGQKFEFFKYKNKLISNISNKEVKKIFLNLNEVSNSINPR